MRVTDVAIIGAGPAGAAAAISCLQAGLSVVILDASEFPRTRPGETLHPGVEAIFEQLGVIDAVNQADFLRHEGIRVEWGGIRRFQAYGRDHTGAWKGYQAVREKLDSLLLDAAEQAGALALRGERVMDIMEDQGRPAGILTSLRSFSSRWVLDASGGKHWLASRLSLPVEQLGPPMRTRFGWSESEANEPLLRSLPDGWEWIAPLGGGRCATCRLFFGPQNHSIPAGMSDVTCRWVPRSAGPGYFLIGDAACVLDPVSSHGVLRALLSGILASHLIAGVLQGRMPEGAAITDYKSWLAKTVHHDMTALKKLYSQHPSDPFRQDFLKK
jgi:flavin-dependent dehydrogenase